jgi:hypothetical protein
MIGPTLPPHLQKRKEDRTEEEDAQVLNGQDPSTLSPPKSVVSEKIQPFDVAEKKKGSLWTLFEYIGVTKPFLHFVQVRAFRFRSGVDVIVKCPLRFQTTPVRTASRMYSGSTGIFSSRCTLYRFIGSRSYFLHVCTIQISVSGKWSKSMI